MCLKLGGRVVLTGEHVRVRTNVAVGIGMRVVGVPAALLDALTVHEQLGSNYVETNRCSAHCNTYGVDVVARCGNDGRGVFTSAPRWLMPPLLVRHP